MDRIINIWLKIPGRHFLPGILLFSLLAWLIAFAIVSPPGAVEPSLAGSGGAHWLAGLDGLQGVHLQEFHRQDLVWELWAETGNIRLERWAIGYMRLKPLLHLVPARATLYKGGAPLNILAARVYYDPRKTEWIFVQGVVRDAGRSKRFERLHWFPDTRRLEWQINQSRNPLRQFFEPIY